MPRSRQLRHCVSRVWRKATGATHRRYTVSPTAVPIKAALRAVETIEPAKVLRLLAGGSSTSMRMRTLIKNVDKSMTRDQGLSHSMGKFRCARVRSPRAKHVHQCDQIPVHAFRDARWQLKRGGRKLGKRVELTTFHLVLIWGIAIECVSGFVVGHFPVFGGNVEITTG